MSDAGSETDSQQKPYFDRWLSRFAMIFFIGSSAFGWVDRKIEQKKDAEWKKKMETEVMQIRAHDRERGHSR